MSPHPLPSGERLLLTFPRYPVGLIALVAEATGCSRAASSRVRDCGNHAGTCSGRQTGRLAAAVAWCADTVPARFRALTQTRGRSVRA